MSTWRPDRYASLTVPRFLADYIRTVAPNASMSQTVSEAMRFYIWLQRAGDMNLKRTCDAWWREIERQAAEHERSIRMSGGK